MNNKVQSLTFLVFLVGCSVTSGSPVQYSMFQGRAYSGTETRQRNKNWCAFVVHKNVTCTVVGGSESSVQPEVSPCPPELPNCGQQVVYRPHFRPTYKIAYKTVTELEWRCCPGYQGHDCMEVKDLRLLQVERLPSSPSTTGHIPVPKGPEVRTDGQRHHPWGGRGQFGGHTGQRPLEGHRGSHSSQHLEEEVQRLSQMVLDMQARMTDMSSNLRLDLQEDASKMLNTLLNNLRQPASARGAETQTVHLQDVSFEREKTPVDEVMNKMSQVTDELESKGNALDDLLARVNQHEGQIHLLMEAARSQTATHPPATPASDVDLRTYVDEKISALRHEFMEGIEIKLADMKSLCDYKITSVQEQCEGQEANYLSLAELMDSKETDLRNEIQDIKTKLVESLVPDSLLARVEVLESRVNRSEASAAAQCLSVEETLKRERAEAIKDLSETLEDKLTLMEDRLTTLLLENTSSSSQSESQTESQDALLRQVNTVRDSFQTLEDRFIALDQMCSQAANLTAVENSCRTAVGAVESRLTSQINELGLTDGLSVEKLQGDLSSLRGRVGRLEDILTNVVHQRPQVPQSLNATSSQVNSGAQQDLRDLLELSRKQHHDLKQQLDELAGEVKADAARCREKTEDVQKEMAHMDSRVVHVESVCSRLDPISGSLQRIREGLNKHVSGLWTCVGQLNGTLRAHERDIGGLRGTCQKLQSHVTDVARDLQGLTGSPHGNTGVQVEAEDAGRSQGSRQGLATPTGPGDDSILQPPVMETGQAGPPGKMTSSKLLKGTDGSAMAAQGFAGAPASPVKPTESLKPRITSAQRPAPQKPKAASDERTTFSAGLTLLSFDGEVGIIRFNKVLVNDGGHYDPHTGIFTAPVDGRYLVTAVLTAQRGEKVEAVLSVSNHSVQRLDSAGFLSGAAAAPTSHDQCNCSSSASLSLVLSLKRGDRVGLVMTGGKLAISASSEILSSFSAVLLYPDPSKR